MTSTRTVSELQYTVLAFLGCGIARVHRSRQIEVVLGAGGRDILSELGDLKTRILEYSNELAGSNWPAQIVHRTTGPTRDVSFFFNTRMYAPR